MAEGSRFPAIVVEELVGAVPTLIDRTRAQIELTQHLLGRLPCLARLGGGQTPQSPSADRSGDELVDGGPVDGGADRRRSGGRARADSESGATVHELRPTGRSRVRAAAAAPEPVDAPPVGPVVAALAIPDYDSLAASQVVPRLAALDSAELADVGAYERAHRGRQTILNRVRQLQDAGER